MINLLPQENQKEIRAAYVNTLLIRYLILLVCALIFLVGAIGFSYFYLGQAGARADETKIANEQKAAGFTDTQGVATTLRSQLSAARSLFDGEIRYSKALINFSLLFPEGTSINGITFNESSFGQSTTLPVQVRGEAEARALQASFESSPFVSGVSMGSVSTNAGAASIYPYTVELIFTLNRSIAQ
jgi:hypothetical protein